MTSGIAELLRTMPDLAPPVDGWQRIAASQVRLTWMWRGGLAAAASVVFALIVGYLYVYPSEPVAQSFIVSAPAIQPDARAIDARVRELQRRSQYMERLLGELPPRARLARADSAGVIAELEDRIAAVDYQLNRVGLNRAGRDRVGASRTDIDRQLFGWPSRRSLDAPLAGDRRDERAQEWPDLWQRRVEFMGHLVRARYAEAAFDDF